MGLDMYLSEERHFARMKTLADAYDHYREQYETADKILDTIDFPKHGVRAVDMKIEVMYWRKANQIHKWFVDNVQNGVDDCGSYEVTEGQLRELLNTVETVLDNPERAEELLPPQSGFFFGGTELDEWYWRGLRETERGIRRVLDNAENTWFIYSSSW